MPLSDPARTRPRVVVAGAGVGGLEAVLALRSLAGPMIAIDLVAPVDEFTQRPMTVAEPFGHGAASRLPLARLEASHGVRHVRDALARVDHVGGRVELVSGGALDYEALIVATGARPEPWLAGAVTFTGAAAVPEVAELLGRLQSGDMESLIFTAPTAGWTLPAYELALLTSAWCAEHGVVGAQLQVVTPEEAPLALFGGAAGRAVRSLFGDRGIRLHLDTTIESFDGSNARLADGATLPSHAVLALPRLRGEPVPGLPADEDGFIEVGELGEVRGVDGVYAVGDAANHPIKQGGLAAQQADAAAAAVAQRLGVPIDTAPFRPVIRGLLLTGLAAAFLRADPEGGSAGFNALWSPPAKVAARFLGPYLEELPSVGPLPELVDRDAPDDPGQAASDAEEARSLALELADADAAWGDRRSALQWLRVIERRDGVLSPELVARREEWEAAEASESAAPVKRRRGS